MPRPKMVLVVEDDVGFAEFVRASVESLGHRAVIVVTGDAAMEAFAEVKPDLVFLDLLLPKRDGFKICEDIRKHEHGSTVPVIMMTGIYRKPLYERDGLERAGATAYLQKPFGVREIWKLIERHLGPEHGRDASSCEASPATAGWSLTTAPLACQLAEHLCVRSDGVLFARTPEVTFAVYLRGGAPIFVRSNDPADRLDRVLLRTGKVTEAQVSEATAMAMESRGKSRIGEILVDRGALSRADLEVSLQLQLRLILNRAFALEAGHCLFVPGEHPTEEDLLLSGHPRALLLRGARSTPIASARANLPSSSSVLMRVEGWEALVGDLNLHDDERRLLQLADGSTTVERFLATASVAGFDGPRILLALQCAGLIADVPGERRGARVVAGEDAWDARAWSQKPFGAAFADLHRRRASGTLEVRRAPGATPKSLVLRHGSLIAVKSQHETDRLASMIAQLQLVDVAALASTVADAGEHADDAALARLLVDRELLSPAEAYWAAVYQAHGATHELLDLPRTTLKWSPGMIDPDTIVLPDVPTAELAWNGLRALHDETVRSLLPEGPATVLSYPDADTSLVPFSNPELAVFLRARDGLSLDEALVLADAEGVELRRTLLALLWLGIARTQSVAKSDERPRAGTERAIAATPSADEDLSAEMDLGQEIEAALGGADAPWSAALKLAAAMLAVAPTVKTLRRAFEGDAAKVSVDRARMAELFDCLIDAAEHAREASDQAAATAREAVLG